MTIVINGGIRQDAQITTGYPMSSCNIPVLVLDDGTALGAVAAVYNDLKVVEATQEEISLLREGEYL